MAESRNNSFYSQPNLPGISNTGPGMTLKMTSGGHNPLPQHTSSIPTLYHGSDKAIPRGQIVKPGGPMSKQFSFATSDLKTAGGYAENRSDTRAEQPALWSVVNKVEPVDKKSTYKDATSHGKKTDSYISRKGFVSKGPSHLVDYKGYMTSTGPNSSPESIFSPSKRPDEFKQGTMFTLSESGFSGIG